MNKEDKQRVIGKVVAINSDRFTIELLSGIDNFNVNGFDDIHYFAQLNSYVILPYQNYYIVAEVAGVREKDLNVPFSNPTEQFLSKVKSGKYLEVLPIGTLKPQDNEPNIYDFDFGVSVYPALYTDTLYIKEAELDAIFNVKNQEQIVCDKPKEHTKEKCDCKNNRYLTLSIGKSTIFPDYDVKVDIDKFFGNHAAILGNTGSGKSCTISSMIQGLCKFNSYSATGSTFILFDVNGEYQQAFSELTKCNEDISITHYTLDDESLTETSELFKLPHWFMNFDEWSLLLQASEKTQQPVLRNALSIAALLEGKKGDLLKVKNHIVAKCCISIWTASESPVSAGHRINALLQNYAEGDLSKSLLSDNGFSFKFGNFETSVKEQKFIASLNDAIQESFEIPNMQVVKFDLKNLYIYLDIAILYEESFGNKQIRDYCSSLLTRAKSIVERADLGFLNAEDIEIKRYKRKVLGLSKVKKGNDVKKKNQIILFDLHSVEDEVVEVVSCVLSRIIYEAIKEIEPRNSYPINLILEEAHRYIGSDPQRTFLKANKIFEQIAKEGRKFGMLLLISSQRPSELSKTVLSQCSNFIVHRIQNPEDLAHIRQITPHISDTILKRMPSIPTQHALIFGHAVNLPTTFKVNEAKPKPKSDNNKISENWFKPKNHIAYKLK
ncbi:MAG: ATP-binding protein [Ignavibacteriae bacterium]|nr:ATP-binding protein [Ignavibacteriota bacterium]